MALERFGIWVAIAGCLVGRAAPVLAQTQPAGAALPASDVADAGKAVVVLVGLAAQDAELQALLRELLASQGVTAELSGQTSFDKDQLLREVARDGAVHVFVVPGAAGNIGLYFRHPDGERFLLRSVLLRGGLDAMGREQIGQIVETAVVSLLHKRDGLTREQTQLALDADASGPAAAEASPPPASPPPKSEPSSSPRPRSPRRNTSLDAWLGLRYGARELGASLGMAHGPGLELGVGVRHGWLARVRLTAQRDFTQTLTSPQIRADIDSLRWRLALDAGRLLTDAQAIVVSVGAGQDRSRIAPKRAPGSSVTPGATLQDTVPVVHVELRYELGRGRFRAAGAVGIDTALLDTHFDVSRSSTAEPVVRPWLVSPTAGLVLAFCPHLTSF
jgi:hypothetical protein